MIEDIIQSLPLARLKPCSRNPVLKIFDGAVGLSSTKKLCKSTDVDLCSPHLERINANLLCFAGRISFSSFSAWAQIGLEIGLDFCLDGNHDRKIVIISVNLAMTMEIISAGVVEALESIPRILFWVVIF